MGNFTITRWACDRCGTECDKRPQNANPKAALSARLDHEWHSEPITWAELCQPCNAAVGAAIEILKRAGDDAARIVKEGNAA